MRRPSRSVIVLCIALIVLLALAWWFSQRQAAPQNHAPSAVPVRVTKVAQQDVPRFATAIGSVLSLHNVQIRPQVDGILTQVLVKEGQWVKQGDLLAVIDDRAIRASLDQARALLEQSQAQLQVAAVDLKRYRLLSSDDGVSKQTFDQQQALVKQLQATAKGNQAAIVNAQVQLSYTQIRSPVTGRVGIRNVDPGNLVRSSDTQSLFSVTQPQQLLPTLQQLLKAPEPALVQAFMDADNQRTLLGEGRLALIDNQISANTGTLRIKAEFDNKDGLLWPGQLVTVKLRTGLDRGALVVPPPVVQRGIDGHYVYRLDGDKVTSVPVKVLFQDSDLTIISGVAAGDLLVVDGQSRLKPGARVEVLGDSPASTELAERRLQP